jgi:hypothetical protein
VDGCEEADCGFVIASCDGTEAFERMEPAFNLVAQAVELAVQAPSPRMQGVLRDDGLHTASSDGVVDGLPRVARVGDAGPAPGMLHQFFGLGGLVPMSLGQRDVDRLAVRRGDRVDLGRKASSRTAQMIASDPPFPPAASWCARTVVASRM